MSTQPEPSVAAARSSRSRSCKRSRSEAETVIEGDSKVAAVGVVQTVDQSRLSRHLQSETGFEGWTSVFAVPPAEPQQSILSQHLRSSTGFEGWTTLWSVTTPQPCAPRTPPALLEAIRAERLLEQVESVHRAYLDRMLGPRPVVVPPRFSEAFVRQLQEWEATNRDYNNLVGVEWAARVNWLEYSDSDLE